MSTNNNQGKWLYMHTLNGVPAQYVEGEQICYANGIRGNTGVSRLCESRTQIKREQRLAKRWRIKRGYRVIPGDYGYVRILKKALIH
jgi:hypothetical protein